MSDSLPLFPPPYEDLEQENKRLRKENLELRDVVEKALTCFPGCLFCAAKRSPSKKKEE